MKNAHHILIYGCGMPSSTEMVYNCGEMSKGADDSTQDSGHCARGRYSQILFAWAHHADGLKLPEGVGFKIGKGTQIEYMVLQVHYAQAGSGDHSGIKIKYTQQV